MRVVLMCHVRYRTADLVHIVSVPQLIRFSVDNFVYSMIPSSSCMFVFCGHYSSKLLLMMVKNRYSLCRLRIAISYVLYVLIIS
jgi:hypothetical protein